MGSAVSDDTKHVGRGRNALEILGIYIDNGYIVAFLIKLLCKRLSDLAAAYDDYIHKIFLSVSEL